MILSKTRYIFVQFRVILHTIQNIIYSRIFVNNLFPAIINIRIIRLNINTLFFQIHQLPSRNTIVFQYILGLSLNLCLSSTRVFKAVNPVFKLLTALFAHLSLHGRITLSIGISYPSATSLACTLIHKSRRSDERNLSKVIMSTLACIYHCQRRVGQTTQLQSLSQLLLCNIMNSGKSFIILLSFLLVQHGTWVHSLRQVSQHKVTNILQSHFLDVLRLPLRKCIKSPIPELLQPIL